MFILGGGGGGNFAQLGVNASAGNAIFNSPHHLLREAAVTKGKDLEEKMQQFIRIFQPLDSVSPVRLNREEKIN